MAESTVKDSVKTMRENLYNRFINAFKDENEILETEEHSSLISDETLKTDKNENLYSQPTNQPVKSSRFQRWIVHYLKAPFQKWENKKSENTYTNIRDENCDDENEEEEEEHAIELDSSSSSVYDDEVSNDEDDENDDNSDDDDDNNEKHSTLSERIQQGIDKVKNLGLQLKENIENKVCINIYLFFY